MPRSIPRFLCETADRLPHKPAVVAGTQSITFSELHRDALATAEALRDLGVVAGDRVGVCMEKSTDQISVLLGILFANAVIVPILPRLKAPNIRHVIENSGMVALVTDGERMGEVVEFRALTRLMVGRGKVDEEWPNLAYLRRHLTPRMFYDRIGADNAAIIYSSGSTGRPKGILIAHRNFADGADIVSQYLDTREDDRIGCILSFNFDYGLNQLWQVIRKGATLHLHDLALPNDLFAFLADNSITALPLMPVIITQMFDRRLKPDPARFDLSSIRYVCTTGGRVSEDMIRHLRRTFPDAKIHSMFGLTEAFRGTTLHPDKLESHPTSIGTAIPGCRVLVLDEDGRECPANVVGELVQRGATVSKGYWQDPENTAKVFRTHPDYPGETLVFSGDYAVRDEDGYLYFVGRRDEMIKTKGFRVSPTEVEDEVNRHAEISAAVAFAVPNISVGEDVGCAYTTVTGAPLPEATLKQYLRGVLPAHMVPAHLFHFESFPVTGNSGKFDRSSIKKVAFEMMGIEPAPPATRGLSA